MAGSIRLGTAGWVFPAWRKTFYPAGTRAKDELAYASRHLGAIEINSTFYRHQSPKSFAGWATDTPPGFRFTVKGHQFVTHIKRLKDSEVPLANFFASGVLALGEKLGPFCWQLPPNLSYDAARIEAFLALLPQSPEALVALAGRADSIAEPFLETTGVTAIRHAIEVRHTSFATPEFLAQLRAHNVALVTSDTAEWPHWDQTADFSYLRLQGAPGAERYSETERDERADRLAALAAGSEFDAPRIEAAGSAPQRDVFAFFVSTDKENAPINAQGVMARLGISGPGES